MWELLTAIGFATGGATTVYGLRTSQPIWVIIGTIAFAAGAIGVALTPGEGD